MRLNFFKYIYNSLEYEVVISSFLNFLISYSIIFSVILDAFVIDNILIIENIQWTTTIINDTTSIFVYTLFTLLPKYIAYNNNKGIS